MSTSEKKLQVLISKDEHQSASDSDVSVNEVDEDLGHQFYDNIYSHQTNDDEKEDNISAKELGKLMARHLYSMNNRLGYQEGDSVYYIYTHPKTKTSTNMKAIVLKILERKEYVVAIVPIEDAEVGDYSNIEWVNGFSCYPTEETMGLIDDDDEDEEEEEEEMSVSSKRK